MKLSILLVVFLSLASLSSQTMVNESKMRKLGLSITQIHEMYMLQAEKHERVKMRKAKLRQESVEDYVNNATVNITWTQELAYAEQTFYGLLDGMSSSVGESCNIGLGNLIFSVFNTLNYIEFWYPENIMKLTIATTDISDAFNSIYA